MLMTREEWQKLTPEEKRIFKRVYKRLYWRYHDKEKVDTEIIEEFKKELSKGKPTSFEEEYQMQIEESQVFNEKDDKVLNEVFSYLGSDFERVSGDNRPKLIHHKDWIDKILRIADPDDDKSIYKKPNIEQRRPPDYSFDYENGSFDQESYEKSQGRNQYDFDELMNKRCPNCYQLLENCTCTNRNESVWKW